ncbi:MAG TPA: putative baseplate assembly protein [Blastocatellia bacterium]|jgi:predicted phage baseplate assembly protein|nr:putative baseplate assembly protein [Blastocatellia bacterium]
MPVRPPALDDRSFDDLVDEALSRIPAHTPEWTNPRPGDPGRTLVELFAWLTDTLLYRANLIPERQRLAFLRLLGEQMRPAIPARGLVSVSADDENATKAIYLRPGATVKGPANFETLSEMTVLPVTAEAYYKRPLDPAEKEKLGPVLRGLKDIYLLTGDAIPYATTPIFAAGAPEAGGFDVVGRTVDKSLWLALLAPKNEEKNKIKEYRNTIKEALGTNPNGAQQLINMGVMPSIEAPALFEDIGPRARIPHVWEITSADEEDPQGRVDYLTLDVVEDSTAGLTRRGVMRLALPAAKFIGAPGNDVRTTLRAGVGDGPPRIDVVKKAERLVAWIRLRPTQKIQSMELSWVGINAVEIDQRQTLAGRVVGQSNGLADQQMQLPGLSVEPKSLELQVEEPGRGYQTWGRVDDLALAGRDDTVYSLDSEAGVVRFGDRVRGRIPEAGARIRVASMRAGGGRAGNLPPGSLSEISARDLRNNPITARLKVLQSLPTEGGEDAETLDRAEQRIPALFRHRDRAVTEEDYRRLAAETPGIRMGRVEVMPRFKPQQRRFEVPGVVSVMVLPFKEAASPPNPRPDRPFLESVHAHLDARRPLTAEMYVIGCEYIPLGVSVAIGIREGFGRDGVIVATRNALFNFLWPLAPGGSDGGGWQLGKSVKDRELEVIVAQVPGVSAVAGINLFGRKNSDWEIIIRPDDCGPVEMTLSPWQLPELLSVVVVADGEPPGDLRGVPNPFGAQAQGGVAVPVVPEVC